MTNPLGEFLSAQRARVLPEDAGLPQIAGRRVTGLRREEVAALAGVSVDYYARLEQGRERTPSAQMVAAIANALRLAQDAREHLYRLAGLSPNVATSTPVVSSELLDLVDAFPHAAAYVVDSAFQILAANPTAVALLGERQVAVGAMAYLFLDPEAREHFVDWNLVARAAVSALRLADGFDDPAVTALVDGLKVNAEFSTMWNDHAVAGLSVTLKRINHPDVGRLELSYQSLDVRAAPGQQLVVATAPAGSPSADALVLLGTLSAAGRHRPSQTRSTQGT